MPIHLKEDDNGTIVLSNVGGVLTNEESNFLLPCKRGYANKGFA